MGSATFIGVTLYNALKRSHLSQRQKIQAACILSWATRLGAFLFHRVVKSGGDRRFKKIKQTPLMFLFAWTLQGFWITACLSPSLRLWQQNETQDALSTKQMIGYTLWAFGFILQVAGDFQKSRFKQNALNKDKFITTGLWSIVRHPNYLGEMVMWFSLWLTSTESFKSLGDYVSFLSPLFVVVLLTKISGIPLLEQRAVKKWGRLPEFQAYMSNTKRLVPAFW